MEYTKGYEDPQVGHCVYLMHIPELKSTASKVLNPLIALVVYFFREKIVSILNL